MYHSNSQLTDWVGVNAQVNHIEGKERKINKSNNIIMQPHHSLMKIYIITTPVKCLYLPLFIID